MVFKSRTSLWAKGDLDNGGAAETADTAYNYEDFDLNDDHDGDGFTTAEEMEAGTDPFHAGTYPQASTGNNANNGYPNLNDDKPVFDLDADDDGDGFTNRQELDANTNPLDKNSFPNPTVPSPQPNPAPAPQPMPQPQPAPTPAPQPVPQPQPVPTQPTPEPQANQVTKEKLVEQKVAEPSQAATPAPTHVKPANLPTTGDSWNLFNLFGFILTSTALLAIMRKRQQD